MERERISSTDIAPDELMGLSDENFSEESGADDVDESPPEESAVNFPSAVANIQKRITLLSTGSTSHLEDEIRSNAANVAFTMI